jgi:hypothetical protein
MDITAITGMLSREYTKKAELTQALNAIDQEVKRLEEKSREYNNELDFNEVQIGLLETLIKRPDGVKIEAVKKPSSVVSFHCSCPDCNPQKAQEPITTAAGPAPTKAAPVKKPVKRSKK